MGYKEERSSGMDWEIGIGMHTFVVVQSLNHV